MAKQIKIKNDVLKEAIEAFRRETGLGLTVKQEETQIDNAEIDAVVLLEDHDLPMAVEVKKWAAQANLGALINQVNNLPMEGLLVADYINPNMAEKLREQGVQFIDTVGNAYINRPPVYVYVKGHRQKAEEPTREKEGTGRAFAVTGLKVIYAFLCDPALVNAPYRTIAEVAGVANGTVGWVLNDLKAGGYIVDRGRAQGRRLVDYRKLLERWVENYPMKLRPKLKVGDYYTDDPNWWQEIDIKKYGAYWGGEVAATKYINYLLPEVVTIYLPEEVGNQLLAAGKLRKLERWLPESVVMAKIYRPFWTEQLIKNNGINRSDIDTEVLVHPILVYADLIATGDTRNRETAQIIYDQYITPIIGQA